MFNGKKRIRESGITTEIWCCLADDTRESMCYKRQKFETGGEDHNDDQFVNSANFVEEEFDDHLDRSGETICVICLEPIKNRLKLSCNHEFCRACIDALREHDVQQLCPLCRKPLPPSAQRLWEKGVTIYTMINRQMSRRRITWSDSPPAFKRKMRDALILFQKAAVQGHARANYIMSVMYATGHGVKKDTSRSLEWCIKAANLGYANAQFNLGVLHEQGHGVTKNISSAFQWYLKAANQGHANAQCNLGLMYENGKGILKDDVRAVEWYTKAAYQKYAPAQCNMGVMYEYGCGVSKDYGCALEWYRKAADQGDANAQYNIGMMYENGDGVPKDDTLAVEWYRKAACQGDADALYNLGFMYQNGNGVPKDEASAAEWYRKAAEKRQLGQ